MTEHVTSADGSRIAYDQWGDGPPLIVVGGLLCDRRRTHELADVLSRSFRVINYDRRGRGESTEAGPYAVDREVEDLATLIDVAGGRASIYGHSSGAALALRAAVSGLPIERLVLHEPPYGADDEESRRAALDLATTVRTAVVEGRPSDALGAFFGALGMPPEMVDEARSDPGLLALAPTMPYDHDVVGDYDRGGVVPEDLVRAIAVPTLVLAGTESLGDFARAAERIVALLLQGSLVWLARQDHGASAESVARSLDEHLIPALGVDGGPEWPTVEAGSEEGSAT